MMTSTDQPVVSPPFPDEDSPAHHIPVRAIAFSLAATLLVWLAIFDAAFGSVLEESGLLSVWLVEPVLLALALTYPYGHFASRFDRWLALVALVLAPALYV